MLYLTLGKLMLYFVNNHLFLEIYTGYIVTTTIICVYELILNKGVRMVIIILSLCLVYGRVIFCTK